MTYVIFIDQKSIDFVISINLESKCKTYTIIIFSEAQFLPMGFPCRYFLPAVSLAIVLLPIYFYPWARTIKTTLRQLLLFTPVRMYWKAFYFYNVPQSGKQWKSKSLFKQGFFHVVWKTYYFVPFFFWCVNS